MFILLEVVCNLDRRGGVFGAHGVRQTILLETIWQYLWGAFLLGFSSTPFMIVIQPAEA